MNQVPTRLARRSESLGIQSGAAVGKGSVPVLAVEALRASVPRGTHVSRRRRRGEHVHVRTRAMHRLVARPDRLLTYYDNSYSDSRFSLLRSRSRGIVQALRARGIERYCTSVTRASRTRDSALLRVFIGTPSARLAISRASEWEYWMAPLKDSSPRRSKDRERSRSHPLRLSPRRHHIEVWVRGRLAEVPDAPMTPRSIRFRTRFDVCR